MARDCEVQSKCLEAARRNAVPATVTHFAAEGLEYDTVVQ